VRGIYTQCYSALRAPKVPIVTRAFDCLFEPRCEQVGPCLRAPFF
jgi:hypothetical protein